MAILSVQSAVVHGHVGNGAAQFALNRLGREVWALNTVVFSNHPGHGGFKGRVTPAAELTLLLEGLFERGFLAQAEAVLSGYLGSIDNGRVLRDAVARVKAANPEAPWLLDPVMGDAHTGVYVKPELVGFFRAAAREAEIVTPNRFELGQLLDRPLPDSVPALREAAAALPGMVVVTSAALSQGRIGTLLKTGAGQWLAWTPRLDPVPHGSGDLFAALLLGYLLDGRRPLQALERAVAAVGGVLAGSLGEADLCLLERQDELVAPHGTVEIEPLQ